MKLPYRIYARRQRCGEPATFIETFSSKHIHFAQQNRFYSLFMSKETVCLSAAFWFIMIDDTLCFSYPFTIDFIVSITCRLYSKETVCNQTKKPGTILVAVLLKNDTMMPMTTMTLMSETFIGSFQYLLVRCQFLFNHGSLSSIQFYVKFNHLESMESRHKPEQIRSRQRRQRQQQQHRQQKRANITVAHNG